MKTTSDKTDRELLAELWAASNALLDYLDPDSIVCQKDSPGLRIAREAAQSRLEELCENIQFHGRHVSR